MFIDTHCHLDAPEFGSSQGELVRGAQKVGVGRMILPAVNRGTLDSVRQICEQYPNCIPAYGIHPLYVEGAHVQDLVALRDYLARPNTAAVGEIGLDFFVKDVDPGTQEFYFVEQLKLAREFDLPVILHIRRAQDIVLKHLRMLKVRGGIAHAFNGSRQQADEFLRLGFKLGFGGAMTYSRATRLRTLATTLPLESIVLETDAPDIPPDFLPRGEPNKPEYLPRIAQTLADLRGLSLEEIARATTLNVCSVLSLDARFSGNANETGC